MRERNFINQNKDKWKELEEILSDNRKDADRMSTLFVQVTDDLSYARTFYKNRFVRIYLNSIAQKVFYNIYKNNTFGIKRFIYFWKEELPRLIYASKNELLFSLIVFTLAITIGVVSTRHNVEFASVILGKDYVEMTLENINKGDPMAVYKNQHSSDMFLGITYNNIMVSFLAFMTGLIFGIGSFGVLLYNGIMIGVFQYFFYKHGLFFTSFVTIWLHGTLEISSIIIASAAGITLGKGIMFPGTYSRMQSFFLSSRRGLKILVGILPLIVMAAMIESYLTRHTDAPLIIKLALILLSLGFIVFYFIIYPYRKHKSHSEPFEDTALHEIIESKFDYSSIYSNGMIFSETFQLYKKNIGRILKLAFIVSAFSTVLYYFFYFSNRNMNGSTFSWIISIFGYEENGIFFLFNTVIFSVALFYIYRMTSTGKKLNLKSSFANFMNVFVCVATLNLPFLFHPAITVIALIIVSPVVLQWMTDSQRSKDDFLKSLTNGVKLIDAGIGKVYGFFFITVFISIVCYFLFNSPIVTFLANIIEWNFLFESEKSFMLQNLGNVFMLFFTTLIILPLIIFGNHVLYYSLREILTAEGLAQKINQLKHRS